MTKAIFENSKIGETVFSPFYGLGKIERIDNSSEYPIIVSFFNSVDKKTKSFTFAGYADGSHEQSLFLDEMFAKIKEEEPTPMKNINDIEVPDISFIPSRGDFCYLPAPIIPKLYIGARCDDPSDINHLVGYGLCYPFTEEGKQAAILHAKAMLSIM
jgi:hypothetical protein